MATLPSPTAVEETRELQTSWREQGVTVDVQRMTLKRKQSTSTDATTMALPTEELAPRSIWRRYCELNNHSATEGLDILDELEQQSPSSSSSSSGSRRTRHLELESVTLQGFGPFVETITYPLANRGLVHLRGVIEDDNGADRYVPESIDDSLLTSAYQQWQWKNILGHVNTLGLNWDTRSPADARFESSRRRQ